MKLLLDQNISFRLVERIKASFPGVQQVKKLGLENKPDREIWDFAKRNNYTIVTFDSDFYDYSLLFGHPPKLIWLKTGNRTSAGLEKLLLSKSSQILAFMSSDDLSCLELRE